MARSERPVLVVASSRDDRRVLFDALEKVGVRATVSARDAVHAHTLLRRTPRPVLAILDFENAPTQSRVLCAELADIPVIGLFGADFGARGAVARQAEYRNVRAWLRVPVDAIEAGVRIREILFGAPPDASGGDRVRAGPAPDADPVNPAPAMLLRSVAEFIEPGRYAAEEELTGLLQRAMDLLGMDLMLIAGRNGGGTLEPLARVDRLSAPGAPDPLVQSFVRRALDGEIVVVADEPDVAPADRAFARETGCVRHAALPLLDAHRNVLGVMACMARRVNGLDAPLLRPLLQIAAAKFAALLELRAERERGRTRALQDALTGLPNRLLFNDRLESTLRDARRTGEVFAVLFADIDHFKRINDSLGHAVGDQVLAAQARRLRTLVRSSDTVARYAGDEFTLILRHVDDRAGVMRVASGLLQGMQAPLILENGSELRVSASIGASLYPDDATDAEGLVKHADIAMYNAKGRGRNSVEVFGDVTGDAQRRDMEAHLREAEANSELSVHYQPQIDLASEEVIGVEALVRWRHPALGTLGSAFFVPLAEETGLIIPIGGWVFRRACADVAGWRQQDGLPFRLAVNVSALQWMQPNLVGMIEAACRAAGLEPRMLDLETPEGVLANGSPELVSAIEAVRRIGCRVVVDDAGTACPAPHYAAHFPVDAIKIDRVFVRNIGRDPDDEATVVSVLDGAHRQGLQVIAEGVETERQLGLLREHGCDAAQGYLFCRPIVAAAMAELLEARHSMGGTAGRAPSASGSGAGDLRALAR